MDPIVIDEAVPPALFAALLEWVAHVPLQYGAKSNSQTDPHGHFTFKPVHDQKLNLADLTRRLPMPVNAAWQEVQKHFAPMIPGLLPPWKLIRCYVNGYVYGTDGYFHRDSSRRDECTAILYLCRLWPIDWAGETAVSGRLYWSVLPAPNRLLIIDSNDMHCARAVSRKCTELRTVLVFKFRVQRTSMFESLSEWLVAQGALDLKHGKDSSLHDHLMRVYWLLHDKVPVDVATAGALHSIYGTNAFTNALIPANDYRRGRVAGQWGKTAEDLAYKFSILDRPRTLDWCAEFIAPGDYAKLELRHKDNLKVDYDTAKALCWIEAANLHDQGALGKWKHLASLWERGVSGSLTTRSETPGGSASSDKNQIGTPATEARAAPATNGK
jgi:SM-20-related protein